MEKNSIKDMYEIYFEPGAYCAAYYNDLDPEVQFFIETYYNMFKEEKVLLEAPKPRNVLDLGCGPVPIYAATAVAASFADNITMAEILQKNRDVLMKWLCKQETNISWNIYFDFLHNISEKRAIDIERTFRQSIYDITIIDLQQEPRKLCSQYSIVMTTLCLEFVAASISEYRVVVERVSRFVQVEGFLMMAGALGNSFYMLSGCKFPSVSLKEEDIRSALEAANLRVFFMKTLSRCSDPQTKHTDHSGVFFVAAQKKKK